MPLGVAPLAANYGAEVQIHKVDVLWIERLGDIEGLFRRWAPRVTTTTCTQPLQAPLSRRAIILLSDAVA
jgi:hypothetical protein